METVYHLQKEETQNHAHLSFSTRFLSQPWISRVKGTSMADSHGKRFFRWEEWIGVVVFYKAQPFYWLYMYVYIYIPAG